MSQKLYVGNLSFGASEEALKNLFLEAGNVESVKIVVDTYSGRPRGFGFVEMASKEEGERAISLLNGKVFMERALVVNEARPQKKRGTEYKNNRRTRTR